MTNHRETLDEAVRRVTQEAIASSLLHIEERLTERFGVKHIDGPSEYGWLVEHPFGPHVHYVGIRDPHPQWRKSEAKDRSWSPIGRHALTGLLEFHKDASKALRFARKQDAEAFIAAFPNLLNDASAAEHQWPAPRIAQPLSVG